MFKIEIKNICPSKKELVLSVYNNCIDEDDGLKVVNGNSKIVGIFYN